MKTFENIIKEIRDVARIYLAGGNESRSTFEMLDSYADRLDEAYKRDIDNLRTDFEKKREMYLQALTKCDSEIARLKAALKPVLECDVSFGDLDEFDCCECKFCAVGDSGCWRGNAIGMQDSIKETQRIYNGGEA